MKPNQYSHFRLGLFFSMFVFMTLVITFVIMGTLAIYMYNSGWLNPMEGWGFLAPILGFLFSSMVVGTVVSAAVGRLPIRPIKKIIDAINQLADGDFSVRLEINRPAQFQELAKSFNRMASELGSIEILRNDFINNFSHEFKTPIGAIKGYAEMLRYADLSPEETNEYLETVIREAKRLSDLSNNILDLSRVETQRIISNKSEFDLTEQIRRCILLLEPKWSQKSIALSLDFQEIRYAANQEMLMQVWLNMMDNAIKFTPKCGEISVRITQNERAVFVSIQDSGCGISPEDTARIFDKFYQADRSHASVGNGLGLAIAKKIVELHGGRIHCRSQVGVGTEFAIELPK